MRRTFGSFVLAVVAIASCVAAPARADYAAAQTQRVAAVRIAALAERAAHKLVTDRDRAIAAVYPATDQLVPAGALEVNAMPAQMTATYVAVPVQITVNGRLERTVYVGYRVTTYVHTAVATHDLAYNSVIGAGDVRIDRVPSTGRATTDVAALVGRKLMHSASNGMPITLDDTTVNPVVGAGSSALLVVRDGDLAISVDVTAKSSGGIGQIVAVTNPRTGVTLNATVTGPGVVEYVLPGGKP
jgi:flagella basal body P-ring formation protein FlgA